MMEIWKDIRGYEGLYQVSDMGRVFGLTSNKFVKPYLNNNGYLKIDLYKKGKCKHFYIHRLVAEAYLINLNNYPQVNHKDEIKTNNCVGNLEFCDSKYNVNYGTGHERATDKVKKSVFCIELNKVFRSITEASKETGICLQSISACCLGKCKTAGQMHWRYAE